MSFRSFPEFEGLALWWLYTFVLDDYITHITGEVIRIEVITLFILLGIHFIQEGSHLLLTLLKGCFLHMLLKVR